MQHKRVLTAFFIAFALFGCSKDSPESTDKKPANNAASPAEAKKTNKKASVQDADKDWDAKVQAYIRLNNSIMKKKRGFTHFDRENRAKLEARAQKGDFQSAIGGCSVGATIEKLRGALAMPGEISDADAAAKKIVDALEQYVPNADALREYNQAKKYEDDQGAKGKEMLPLYLECVKVLRTSTEELEVAVSALAKKAHEKTLARYKAEGRLLDMHTLEALGAAEKIVETFESAADFKNAEKIKSANEQLELMEKSIEGIRAEYKNSTENVGKRSPSGALYTKPRSSYDSVASILVDLAGAYRESRKSPEKFERVVDKYNGAVNSYNQTM